MAKIISAIVIIVTIISCSQTPNNEQEKQLTPENIVRKNAEESLSEKLNDPSSYQFVSLNIIDTIKYKQNINEFKKIQLNDIEWAESRIKSQLDYKKTVPSMYDENELIKYQQELVKTGAILSGLDSIERTLGEEADQTAAYLYIIAFRATNAMGALVLNEYYLQVSAEPDFSILKMTDEKDKLFIMPNGFPGQQDLYSRFKD